MKGRDIRTGTKGTIPNKLGGNTECTGDTEQDGIELHLSQPVMGEEDTRVSINVGPWVLGFSGLMFTLR